MRLLCSAIAIVFLTGAAKEWLYKVTAWEGFALAVIIVAGVWVCAWRLRKSWEIGC